MDRITAFCSPNAPEVFQSVAFQQQLWTPDPFDVEEIHAEAREAFARLLNRATTEGAEAVGSILLLKGEAGCGKTHLMRAFRNHVHGTRAGYVGYLQMTSIAQNYARYMLGNLIDSLDKPYDKPRSEVSGLRRLSNSVAENPTAVPPDRLQRLREADLTTYGLAQEVTWLADRLVMQDEFAELDLDLIRALLYLQRDDPRIKGRVLRYLRCQDLNERDRDAIGGLVPRTREEDAALLVQQIGTLIARLEHGALVLCIDQLEDLYNLDDSDKVFPRVMSTVCELINRTPSMIVVISCLEDYYTIVRSSLSRSFIDRIERSPKGSGADRRRRGTRQEALRQTRSGPPGPAPQQPSALRERHRAPRRRRALRIRSPAGREDAALRHQHEVPRRHEQRAVLDRPVARRHHSRDQQEAVGRAASGPHA
jgi:hypothetical protein